MAQIARKRRGSHLRHMQIPPRTRKTAGMSPIKLYFSQTARAKARPKSVAFNRVGFSLGRNLSKQKSRSTNEGIVVQSVPSIVAWITRTGRKVSKKTRPK